MNSQTKLRIIPGLDDLVNDPSKAADITPREAGEVLVKLVGIQTLLMGRVLSGNGNGNHAPQDELLTVKQGAGILHVSPDWIYRNKSKLPYIIKVGGSIRINKTKLNKAIRDNQIR